MQRRRIGFSLDQWLDRLSKDRFAIVVLAPGLLLIGAVVLPPILAAFGMSLFRIELLRDDLTPFVGFRNYLVRLPQDAEFLGTLPLTLGFAGSPRPSPCRLRLSRRRSFMRELASPDCWPSSFFSRGRLPRSPTGSCGGSSSSRTPGSRATFSPSLGSRPWQSGKRPGHSSPCSRPSPGERFRSSPSSS